MRDCATAHACTLLLCGILYRTESMDFQLPEQGKDADISCLAMTNEFLARPNSRSVPATLNPMP